ncbi:MAG TPA: hypothetical protein VLE43_18640 [Candidatus Saccharimonadia bacterium]|nr:hypothetical protein [Candidatus Saccharimonadia bacterium]
MLTPFAIFVSAGLIASLVLGAWLTSYGGWRFKKFLIIATVIFITGWSLLYANYRLSAKVAFFEDSPDGRFRVVVYRLPNYSMTPGGGWDAPAIARLFDSKGRCLEQGDIEMLQVAYVEWYEDEVMAGSHLWDLKGR